MSVVGWIHEDIAQYLFAPRAAHKCLVGRQNWVAFFAGPLAFDEAGVQIFLADLQKLHCAFIYFQYFEKSIIEIIDILYKYFLAQYAAAVFSQHVVEHHSQSVEFAMVVGVELEVGFQVAGCGEMLWDSGEVHLDAVSIVALIAGNSELYGLAVDIFEQFVVEVVGDEMLALCYFVSDDRVAQTA